MSEYEGKILSCVIAILRYQDKILLIKRKKEPYIGKYALIGGKVEFGEQITDSAIRESIEETGIRPMNCEYKGYIHEIVRNNGKERFHFDMHLFLLDLPHLNFVESDEGKLKAFKIDEIKENKDDFIPSDYLMIKEAMKEERLSHYSLIEEEGNKHRQIRFERI